MRQTATELEMEKGKQMKKTRGREIIILKREKGMLRKDGERDDTQDIMMDEEAINDKLKIYDKN